MPKSCFVTGCTNNIQSKPEFQYYILPQDKARRKLWLMAIGRAHIDSSGEGNLKLWSPKSRYIYVCSEHYISRIYI